MKMHGGFTVIELMVVITVVFVITAMMVPRLFSGFVFGADRTFEDAQEIAILFGIAQSMAASNQDNDHWGIKVVDNGTTDCNTATGKDCVVLYKGKTFATRDTAYDEIFLLRGVNQWNMLKDTDFYFNKKTGFAKGLDGLPHDAQVHYPFTASTTRDISGNDRDGTFTGTGSFVQYGCANNSGCIQLDGVDGYVDIPNSVLGAQNSTGVTYTAWVSVNNASDNAIVGGATDSTYDYYGSGGIWLSLGKPAMSGYNGTTYCHATAANALPTGTWHHVAGTYDTAADELAVYVDGSQAATASCTSITAGMGESYVGRNAKSSNRMPFNGQIDDILIFKRELTDLEISQLFLLTRPTSTTTGERVISQFYIVNGNATSTVLVYSDGHAEALSDHN